MFDEPKGWRRWIPGWARRIGPWWVVGLFAAGIVFWGGFNWAFELTNTEKFCISCHEMQENVFKEYQHTVHYTNRSGVRATCPDCHVPKEWGPKIVRKIQASNELWHKALGSIDTPEKFQAKRIKLAENEWRRMKANDSQECRNCHHFEYMDFTEQGRRAVATHCEGVHRGQDLHRLPQGHRAPAAADRAGDRRAEAGGGRDEEVTPRRR